MGPVGSAVWNARRLSLLLAGTAILSTPVMATDNNWLGLTTDWNSPANWSLNRVPVMPNGDLAPADNFDDAIINTQTPNFAVISATIPALRDIKVGNGAGSNGRVDHTAGTAATGGGNWMRVGTNSGQGTYNLANTLIIDPGVSGYAQGTGDLTVGGRLYVGGDGAAGSIGVMNINTSGTVAISSQLQVGTNGTGTLNLQNGTVTTANEWVEFGNGAGSVGTLNMSGGTLTKSGGNDMAFGTNGGIGVVNHSGGILNNNNEFWVGQAGGSVGIYNLSNAGVVNTNSWVAIGRQGGTGNLNISGGTFNKTGGGEFIIGDNTSGVATITGGSLIVNSQFWVGQAGSGNGKMTVSGGTVSVGNWLAVGREGATGVLTISGNGLVKKGLEGSLEIGNSASSVGTVNLDGGTLQVDEVVSGNGANSTFNFNGGTLKAIADVGNFMQGLSNAWVKAGGAVVDTDGFNVTINQVLKADLVSTGGGLVKNGAGVLSLSASNNFTGGVVINQGTVATINANGQDGSLGSGPATIKTGATLRSDNGDSFGYNGGAPSVINVEGGTITTGGAGNFRTSLPNLNMTGGTLTSAGGNTGDASGIFSINGTVITTNASAAASVISTTLGLAAVNTDFNIADGAAVTDLVVSGPLINTTYSGNAAGITKNGAGTMRLEGINLYTGATNVNGGTLALLGSVAGNVSVGNGGTLAGTGTVTGSVSVADGGTVAPGTSPGTLVTGGFNLLSASSLSYELAAPGVVGGGVNDLIAVNGALVLDGTLKITPLPGFGNGSYRIFDYTGLLTNNGLDLEAAFLLAYPGSSINVATPNQVNLTVVPEPAATLSALAGLGLLFGRRRRAGR